MEILKKEQIFNRWLVWVKYTEDESALLQIDGTDEPDEATIRFYYDQWLIARDIDNGASN